MRRSIRTTSLLTALGLLCLPATGMLPAAAATTGVTVVAIGLEGPRQLYFDGQTAYVADSDDGQVRVLTADGKSTAVQSRLGNAQGVAVIGGKVVTAVGATDPDETGKTPPRG